MNDLHLSFTHLLVAADELGFDLEISETGGYILQGDDQAISCMTLGEVAVELGRVRVELYSYADEWDKNLHRIRPVL